MANFKSSGLLHVNHSLISALVTGSHCSRTAILTTNFYMVAQNKTPAKNSGIFIMDKNF